MKFKDVFALVILVSFAAFATWKGMQTIASVSIIGFVLIIYKNQMILLRTILLNLVKSAKQAKLGQFEVEIGDKTIDSNRFQKFSTLTQILLATTSSEEIGLLAEISKVDKFELKETLKLKLRGLRDKGLIAHDNATLDSSTQVWATQTGKELLQELMTPPI